MSLWRHSNQKIVPQQRWGPERRLSVHRHHYDVLCMYNTRSLLCTSSYYRTKKWTRRPTQRAKDVRWRTLGHFYAKYDEDDSRVATERKRECIQYVSIRVLTVYWKGVFQNLIQYWAPLATFLLGVLFSFSIIGGNGEWFTKMMFLSLIIFGFGYDLSELSHEHCNGMA